MYQIDFQTPIHVHFIGIGGISMSGLAEILLAKGFPVSGSDTKQSPLTDDLAAKGAKVIDIALKYGYDSPESFTRAFVRFHGITPSQAKKSGAKLKSFSRLTVKLQLEGGSMMDYKLEKHPAFKIVGKKKMIPTTDQEQQNAIPAFWDQVQADGTLQYLHSAGNGTLLGICRDTLTD